MSMWEPFSPGARYSMVNAQEEAVRHGDAYIAPHHILLGALRQSDEPAVAVLSDRGLTLEVARAQLPPVHLATPAEEMVFTPGAKQSIELAFETAREHNHRYLGVEHLLCGLIRSNDSTVFKILAVAGIDPDSIRPQIMKTARTYEPAEHPDALADVLTSQVHNLDITLRKHAEQATGDVHLRSALAALYSTISELMKRKGE